MTTIFERVKTALNTLSPAVAFSLAPYKGTLPDTYIVYQLIVSTPESHFDNVEAARGDLVQVSIYSRAGLTVLPDVDTAMIGQGFMKGDWRQLPQDAETGHYGLAKDYQFTEFAVLP